MSVREVEARHPHTRAHRPLPVRTMVIGLAAIAALVALRMLTAGLDASAIPDAAQDFLTLTVSVIIESLPFVILGILLSIVVQVWVPDSVVMRVLPKNPAGRRVVISVLGVLLPVCECGNMPLARGLMVKGLTVSESMTFLLAAPIVNPITIVTTYQAFGFSDGILIARVIGGFLIANIIGWVFSAHPNQFSLLTDRFAAECRIHPEDDHHHGKVGHSVDLFVREAAVIMPALFLGAVAAGLVQTAVPRQVLVDLGTNPVWSILAMLALAFVISVCSNVDAFFVLPFASTFLPGSIVAFLVFGPMIDIKMLSLMRTTFQPRVLVQLTILAAIAAAALGLVVNTLA